MRTFKTAGGGRRHFQKASEFASEEELESMPGAAGKRLERF